MGLTEKNVLERADVFTKPSRCLKSGLCREVSSLWLPYMFVPWEGKGLWPQTGLEFEMELFKQTFKAFSPLGWIHQRY